MRSAMVVDGVVTNVIEGILPDHIECDDTVGIGWSYDGEVFTPPIIASPQATIEDVKAEAHRRITELYPEFTQLNMMARASEFNDKRADGGTLTAAEQTERTSLLDAWTWVKAMREASNEIEADLRGMTIDEMKVDTRWPE